MYVRITKNASGDSRYCPVDILDKSTRGPYTMYLATWYDEEEHEHEQMWLPKDADATLTSQYDSYALTDVSQADRNLYNAQNALVKAQYECFKERYIEHRYDMERDGEKAGGFIAFVQNMAYNHFDHMGDELAELLVDYAQKKGSVL